MGMLGDSSVAVRMRSIEALGKIGDSATSVEIVKRLERCSAGGSPAGRACLGHSITAMARIKDPGAIPALERLSGSEDPEIRRRAIEALDRLQSGSAGLLLNADSTGTDDETGLFLPAVTDAVAFALAADRRNSTIAILETTEGIIEIELFRENAPLTAASFVLQAKAGGFDGLSLAPAGPFIVATARYERPANNRRVPSEVNMRPFVRGSVGVALSGRDSRADSFFITLAPKPYLDGVYTCFGRVVSGIQVAERMVSNSRIKRIRIKETISFHDYRRY
jgi:cyclophilin family peptidyl-prolyl cis-trans isomerase